jgi:sec-independent protein translocase protein TatB
MFDIGFLEILVILVITLIVVGPERMPEVARKAGQYMGKVKNFIATVKDDSNLRDTIRELQQAVDLKEEQKRFETIQQDMFKGFEDVRDQINFDELQRPFTNSDPTPEQREKALREASLNDSVNAQLEPPTTQPLTVTHEQQRTPTAGRRNDTCPALAGAT